MKIPYVVKEKRHFLGIFMCKILNKKSREGFLQSLLQVTYKNDVTRFLNVNDRIVAIFPTKMLSQSFHDYKSETSNAIQPNRNNINNNLPISHNRLKFPNLLIDFCYLRLRTEQF